MFSKVGKDRPEDAGTSLAGKGKEWFFLLLSVFLAAVVWLVYSLSLSYNVFLDYPVQIKTNLPGFESRGNVDQHIIVRAQTDGFYIVDRKLASYNDPIKIDVDAKFLVPCENEQGKFSIDSKNISQEFSNALGNNVNLEYIVTDSLTVYLNPVASKKVPVAISMSVTCAPQYRISSGVSLIPDSVYVAGDESLISTIDSVWTENVSFSDIRADVEGVVPISKINGVEFSSPAVAFSFDVNRYVEEKISLPVVVHNLPSEKKAVLLPDRVDVTFIRFYPVKDELSAKDFECSVDYDGIISTPGLVTVPTITGKPAGTADFRMSPEVVECIILDK